MKILGNILIAASSLFFIETAFEVYLPTILQGQQMLFSRWLISPRGSHSGSLLGSGLYLSGSICCGHASAAAYG